VQVWRAGVDHPGAVVCSGPKYQYDYVDGLHTTTASYERIGEKYAEVFDAIVNQNIAWKPLQPSHVVRSGAVITIDFDVPNPPLAWEANIPEPFDDTAHPAWKAGHGFQVTDGGGADVAIASAAIQGSSVVLTLAQAPAAGAQLTVGYAITKGAGTFPLPIRGQLRDSDDFVGWSTDTVDVNVTAGSATVSSVSATGFARRAAFDLVTGTGVPAGTIIAKKTFDNEITLSSPWPGATGKASMAFRHDHRNYAVQFSMPVP
jgi:hypothetical protein